MLRPPISCRGRTRRRAVELAPAQERAHPACELGHRERLGDIVVGAELEPEHPVQLGVLRGEHDDRKVALGTDGAADFGARELGHHHVEQEQVVTAAARGFERRFAVFHAVDLEPLLPERIGRPARGCPARRRREGSGRSCRPRRGGRASPVPSSRARPRSRSRSRRRVPGPTPARSRDRARSLPAHRCRCCRSDRTRVPASPTGIPAPVSATATATEPSGSERADSVITPWSVCLTALAARFASTCCARSCCGKRPEAGRAVDLDADPFGGMRRRLRSPRAGAGAPPAQG